MNNINKYISKINKLKNKKINQKEIIKIKKKFLNKNGIIDNYLKLLKLIKNKKKLGKKINILKSSILLTIKNNSNIKKDYIKFNINNDFFYKNNIYNLGSKHPITLIKDKILNIFYKLNFNIIYDNKEIETDWYNFKALNFPKYHPSRDMQDTFYINNNNLLRTHTSSIQIRYMTKNKPPIRIITYGKVYRNESISKYSFNMFHQIELLYVDKNKFLSIIYLKEIIKFFINIFLGDKYKIRFRISYFPFTNPSFEVDLYYNKKWLEIIGCGMVNQKVFKNVNYNYKLYRGLAIGIGLERLAMIYYKIKDIRLFFNNDIRTLKQFKSEL
ncbi:MAG: phenylalanine--tRNA ligase subunit alpha [Candidatus Shikimatogenerans bostrichidophilus]|nr:MAG: phenylalanine--tRNA ligase subunit alpha [Candidatus Shikimatogenerans bostrichidophilus]